MANNTVKCPYYTQHGTVYISCKRGHETKQHRCDNIKRHVSKKCSNHYTDCSSYNGLERSWGHL